MSESEPRNLPVKLSDSKIVVLPIRSIFVLVFAPALLAPPVSAQEPEPPPPPREIPIDEEGGIQFPLTLEEALVLGVRNNTDLRIDELLPYQAMEDVRAAQSVFEPELFSEVRAGGVQSPPQVFQAAGLPQPAINQERYSGRFGVRQLVPSGGLFDLSYSPSSFRQVSGNVRFRQVTNSFAVSYTQPLLRSAWSDYTLRDVHVQESLRAAASSRYERAVQNTLLAVVQAYWELVFSRENYFVALDALELAREQLERTNRKIEVGELAPLDKVADEAEVARREEELVTAENEIRNREDDLRRLLFDDGRGELWTRHIEPETPIGEFPEGAVELEWRELAAVAQRVRPDLRALRAEVAVAEILVAAAERDVLPRLDLVSSFTSDGVASNFPTSFSQATGVEFPDWSVELQLAVPLGNNAALAARDRARLEVERTRRVLYSASIDVTLEVRDAVRQLKTLAKSIDRGRESVRLAVSNLDREQARKEAGTSTSFEVQQRNQELQEARSRLLRNELDYRVAESTLLFVQGILELPMGGSDAGR